MLALIPIFKDLLELMFEGVDAMGNFMLAEDVVEARRAHLLDLVELLVLGELLELEEGHVDGLHVVDVVDAHPQDEVQGFDVLLAVEEDLVDGEVEEEGFEHELCEEQQMV